MLSTVVHAGQAAAFVVQQQTILSEDSTATYSATWYAVTFQASDLSCFNAHAHTSTRTLPSTWPAQACSQAIAKQHARAPATLPCLLALLFVYTAVPQSFGEELLSALLCQQQPAATAAAAPPATPSPTKPGMLTVGDDSTGSTQVQLTAGRAAMALSFLLQHNPMGQLQLLALQVPGGLGSPPGSIEPLTPCLVKLLQNGTRRADGKALPLCYSLLRLLVTWCSGCTAAVSALLAPASHLPLLVDLVGRRAPAGDAHTAGASGAVAVQNGQMASVDAGSHQDAFMLPAARPALLLCTMPKTEVWSSTRW